MKIMKLSTLALVFAGLTLVGCKKEIAETSSEEGTQNETSKVVAKAETTSFKIDGMTCAMGCAKTIENKLAGLDGVQKATVDFEKKTATVEYDAAVQTPEKLVETVEAVADGKTYKVSDVKNSADKAMNYQEPKQDKKKKAAKANDEAKTTAAPEGEKKVGCCAGKKACSEKESKPATL
ncbi:heavy-metal-associated domain-containing protein [Flavobacterium amniphilum]|uniref:heavy-metal-associated domain-containing protein n=1 Tax=Flavobacterium amniphilum TaxID=1834035 RepID=UPI00293E4920|nr:heavy metal-associated domain-containing protein [Flavobacterium amniphilum]